MSSTIEFVIEHPISKLWNTYHQKEHVTEADQLTSELPSVTFLDESGLMVPIS